MKHVIHPLVICRRCFRELRIEPDEYRHRFICRLCMEATQKEKKLAEYLAEPRPVAATKEYRHAQEGA